MAVALPTYDLGRPIRVVFFGGAFLEPAALEFLARLDEHSEIELLGGFCQSPGFELGHMIGNIIRRRGLAAPAVLGIYAAQGAWRLTRYPRARLQLRRRVSRAFSRIIAVRNIHAPEILQQVRALRPDLGLSYGSPILKPELFDIPAFGTLGIHQGSLPKYRGIKTTFWAMANGEPTTGVAIQRISAGLDTGEIVSDGEVAIEGKRYGRVDAEVQELGVNLYVNAIIAVKRGRASCRPQPSGTAPLYRQPSARDVIRLWRRQLLPRRG